MSTGTAASISSEQLDALRTKSLAAREVAYCPYSKFRVGCAILTSTGEYITGANVENASYGGTICAERTAIVKAVTEGHMKFAAMGVATFPVSYIGSDDSDLPYSASPCGLCRQVIREFGPKVPIYMFTSKGDYEMMTLDQLLPKSFGPEDLGLES